MKTPEAFMEYFRTNYPGPSTIIARPDWHAQKIYAAAIAASGRDELLEALKLSAESFCSMECPSVWKTADYPSRPHTERCAKIRAVIAKAEGAE